MEWYKQPGAFTINRRLAKISQRQIAERAGITQALVSMYENQLQSWDSPTGKRILEVYAELAAEISRKQAEEYLKSPEHKKEHAENERIYGPGYVFSPLYFANEVYPAGKNLNLITQKHKRSSALKLELEIMRWHNEKLLALVQAYQYTDSGKLIEQIGELSKENIALRDTLEGLLSGFKEVEEENGALRSRVSELEENTASKSESYELALELMQVMTESAFNHERAEELREKIRQKQSALKPESEK